MAYGKKSGGRDWKPGQCGNPDNVGTRLPADLKHARELTQKEFQKLLNQLLHMEASELKKFIKRKEATVLEKIVGSICQNSFKYGDNRRLEFLVERLIGKVPDKLEVKETKTHVIYRIGFDGEENNPTEANPTTIENQSQQS